MRFPRSTPLLFLVSLFFIAVPLLHVTPVLAQSEVAVTHYKAATAYYNQGRYDDAIREFKEAYRLSKKADLYYNIAQAYERMGKLPEAISAYQRYLDESKAKNPVLLEKIANLRARIKKTAVTVRSNVSGAKILIDGKVAGTTPLAKPLPVKTGGHEVRVEKAGYLPFTIRIAVSTDATVDVNAKLVTSASASPGPKTPIATAMPVSSASTTPASSKATPVRRGRLWTWVSLGVAGVALGVAAGTGIAALGKAGDAKTDSDADAKSATTLALVSDITLGVGIAAVVTGVVLFFVEGQGERKSRGVASSALHVTPTFSPTFSGVSARLRF